MEKYRNEVHEYFSQMSREELKNLLEEVGFEVEDGDGRIVFTGDTDLLDRFMELDQLHSVLLYKVDRLTETRKDLESFHIKDNRDTFDKHLEHARREIIRMLQYADFDEVKLGEIIKARKKVLERKIKYLKLNNIGTMVNMLEEFHHDLVIDIKRNIVTR